MLKRGEQNKQEKLASDVYDMHKKNYEKRMSEATSLFDRRYYRNYLDTPTARNMLKQVQEQMKSRSEAMRRSAAVMGYTPESLAINQKSNIEALDRMMGNLAQADVAAKEQASYNYEARRNQLNDYLFNAEVDKRKAAYEQEVGHLNNIAELVPPLLKGFDSKIESGTRETINEYMLEK